MAHFIVFRYSPISSNFYPGVCGSPSGSLSSRLLVIPLCASHFVEEADHIQKASEFAFDPLLVGSQHLAGLRMSTIMSFRTCPGNLDTTRVRLVG